MPDHLDLVRAKDAAQALRDLQEEIPLSDEEICNGLIDWVEVHPGIVRHAATLDDGIADVAPKVWNFMQVHQDDLPDPEIPEKNKGLLSRSKGQDPLIELWLSSLRDSSSRADGVAIGVKCSSCFSTSKDLKGVS